MLLLKPRPRCKFTYMVCSFSFNSAAENWAANIVHPCISKMQVTVDARPKFTIFLEWFFIKAGQLCHTPRLIGGVPTPYRYRR